MLKKLSLVLSLVFIVACRPPSDHRNENQKKGIYPIEGRFNEPIAAILLERNGMIDANFAMGSGFLVDKKRGIFATARHVISRDTRYKLFFCGHVYSADRIIDPSIQDIGFLKIVGDFDPWDFPEPYRISSTYAGDRAFVRGIHMHPKHLQTGHVIHSIVSGYYQSVILDINFGRETKEFVYDNLPAWVWSVDEIANDEEVNPRDAYGILTKNYSVATDDDHVFSFGGLSGGPTVNERDEIIGINITQLGDEGETELDETGLHYKPRITLNLLPETELIRALALIK